MKITKYVHSCLLVESAGRTALFDPGNFSYDAGFFSPAGFKTLDDIIITHEHTDHCHIPLLQELVKTFPSVTITTNPAVAAKLAALGFTNVTTENSLYIKLFATEHESLAPLGQAPVHTGVHYLGKFTNPGDSHTFTQCKDVLALPVTAPWGCMVRAAGLALELNPKFIVPVHDWHWNSTARQQAYQNLESFFAKHEITFLNLVDGKTVEIEV